MNYQILTASVEDLSAILDLQKLCYRSEAALHNDFAIPPLTQTLDSIQDDFKQGTLFLKVEYKTIIIASVRGRSHDGTAYIGRLIVKDEFQNNKIGQTLMKAIEDQFSNCRRFELFTGHKSEKNISLYRKLGYAEFKRQFVNDNLTLVYLEKHNGQRRDCEQING